MYSHDSDCACLEQVEEKISEQYIMNTLACLDDLYTTAIRLTGNATSAETLVQCTLYQGAQEYADIDSPQVLRPHLLNVMKNNFYQ